MKPAKKGESPRAPARDFDESTVGEEGGGGSYGHPRPPHQDRGELPEDSDAGEDEKER